MRVKTIDAHVAGAAIRLVTAGLPAIEGDTMSERRASFEAAADGIRRLICLEPRGHAGVLGIALTEPDRAEADAGVLFFDGMGMPLLSRAGLIGATALALDARLITPRIADRLELDTEAGPVSSQVTRRSAGGQVAAVSVDGPPAAVVRGNARVTTASRSVSFDLAWSGADVLAIAEAEAAGVPLAAARALELQRAGVDLLRHVNERFAVAVPGYVEPRPVDGVVFVGAASHPGADVRAVLVRADGRVSRTPSGSGTAAVCAVLSAMGVLGGGVAVIESLGGAVWSAQVSAAEPLNGAPSVRVAIESPVFRTGVHEFTHDAEDPLIGVTWL